MQRICISFYCYLPPISGGRHAARSIVLAATDGCPAALPIAGDRKRSHGGKRKQKRFFGDPSGGEPQTSTSLQVLMLAYARLVPHSYHVLHGIAAY